jgi:FkbM family methyltransferase
VFIDFVDIGTSDFDIGNGHIENDKFYLLVEPIQFYLNNLPNTSKIIKANYAISDKDDIIKVYYIQEQDIIKYNLPHWVRGCNKINEKHPTVTKLLQQYNLSEDIIIYDEIKCITFSTLIKQYNVTKIRNLKIDTEGHDHIVLKTVKDCLFNSSINIESIKVEYIPVFGNTQEIDILRNELKEMYPNQSIQGDDLHLNKI